jgi:hypothetical protein
LASRLEPPRRFQAQVEAVGGGRLPRPVGQRSGVVAFAFGGAAVAGCLGDLGVGVQQVQAAALAGPQPPA